MTSMEIIDVELSVVLGNTEMPVHQLLRMGRGAVIALNSDADEDLTLLANGMPIADVQVVLKGENISIEVKYVHGRERPPPPEIEEEEASEEEAA
ncbi:MAG: FliM/FliN family flagellar motor switch protein [Rhizobiales bacterium]|nr:FliM/FliN family flagellar motor switch protein [Hyphomicrobiales bacterium]